MIHFTNIHGERLPEDVNKIANERYEPEFWIVKPNELDVVYGFDWELTKEGWPIWNDVMNGNYEPLREFHRNNTEKPNTSKK